MTVIRPNSISGITSITAKEGALNFYDSAGSNLPVTAGAITVDNINATGVSTFSTLNVTNGTVISGVTTVSAGSTSAPSITPSGNSNTGIFFPSSDTIAFTEGGAEAARFDSSGNFQIANGNLVFSTAGTGIDFSATSDGSGTMTSELLDDYEEGTWTATIVGSSSAGTHSGGGGGAYIKIGNMVTVHCNATWSGGTGTGNLRIQGLPFTSNANFVTALGASSNLNYTSGQIPYGYTSASNVINIGVSAPNTGAAALAYDSTASIYLVLTYFIS